MLCSVITCSYVGFHRRIWTYVSASFYFMSWSKGTWESERKGENKKKEVK